MHSLTTPNFLQGWSSYVFKVSISFLGTGSAKMIGSSKRTPTLWKIKMELELVSRTLHFFIIISIIFTPLLTLFLYMFTSDAKIWESAKMVKSVWASLGIVVVGLIVAATLVGDAGTDEMNKRFNDKLAEKYDSTSSRSFAAMKYDLENSGEASTVLTRDGVETTVFLKVIKDGSKNFHTMKLALTVFDEGSLYPEAN